MIESKNEANRNLEKALQALEQAKQRVANEKKTLPPTLSLSLSLKEFYLYGYSASVFWFSIHALYTRRQGKRAKPPCLLYASCSVLKLAHSLHVEHTCSGPDRKSVV